MFFYYMKDAANIGITQIILAFDSWGDGYLGYSLDELNGFIATGSSI